MMPLHLLQTYFSRQSSICLPSHTPPSHCYCHSRHAVTTAVNMYRHTLSTTACCIMLASSAVVRKLLICCFLSGNSVTGCIIHLLGEVIFSIHSLYFSGHLEPTTASPPTARTVAIFIQAPAQDPHGSSSTN